MANQDRQTPLSYGQQRLWFFDRLQPRSSLYNMHHVMSWQGSLDVEALKRAIREVVDRHDVLRTVYRHVEGQPVQVVLAPDMPPFSFVDLSGQAEEKRERAIRRLLNEELQQGFDLGRGPILNFVLVRLEAAYHALSVCVHHIAFDDWSVAIFERELIACYDDAKAGRPFTLAPVPLQYAAFGASQRTRFGRESLDPQLAYWRERLSNLPSGICLTTDRPRPATQTFSGAIRTFAIAPRPAEAFRTLTRNAAATPFMSLFAAFAILLHRYSGETDLVVGTPVANRNGAELAQVIGFFVNTLVLRVDLGDDPTFTELLARVREMTLGALANQDVPFELLVEELRPDREANRQPLFQTMFVFQTGHAGKEGGQDLPSSGAKFDLTFTAIESGPDLCGELEYNPDLFEQATMVRMADHFETLIASIVANPNRPISEFALLSPPERQRILDWNQAPAKMPSHRVTHIIDALAASQGTAPALVHATQVVTYAQLSERAAAFAHELDRIGVKPQARIGLCLERTPEWIVAMLGLLKAGCTMVPLDPALPAERLMFMLNDADISHVVCRPEHQAKFADGVTFVAVGDGQGAASDAGEVPDRSQLGGLAYIIYTSGSTGRPKGVLVEHRGLTNLALSQGAAWSVGPDARVLQFASIGFDASISEVFSTLCLGAALYLSPPESLMPGTPLLRTLRDCRITHVTLPPSALAAMQAEALTDLRVVISAGETCERDLAHRWAHGRRFVNAYGPTETTVCATMGDYDARAASVPVGRPLPNVQVYVLDRHGEPVPPGVTGEIFVGGVGVARGYLNQPDLTAKKFIADRLGRNPDGRLYATGDLGRFDAAGVLHHLGRIDNQLKVRGYRIEPGEIETQLRLHPRVKDARVLGHGKGSDARLIAYVVPVDVSPLVVELRGFLTCQLPEYMLPAAFIVLPEWPRTPNGKVDHAALPPPDNLARQVTSAFVEPTTRIEHAVAEIWCACLGLEEVGTSDNFFDLGGHSLLLVRVLEQMKEKLKVELPLTDLFRHPTVKRQAEMLAARMANQAEADGFVQADERAARQTAARSHRRIRNQTERHA